MLFAWFAHQRDLIHRRYTMASLMPASHLTLPPFEAT